MAEAAAAPAQVTTPADAATSILGSPTPPATPAAEAPKTEASKEPAKVDAAKTDAPKTDAPKTEPAEKVTVVPEKYDLKLPEGSQLDPSRLEKVAALAKEQGMTAGQAQALIDSENAAVSAYADKAQAEMKAQPDKWMNECRSDKEIGGESFARNAEVASRAIQTFATPELVNVLNKTGLGNHPELVRVFARIGKAMEDSKFVPSGGQPATRTRSASEVLYSKKDES